jgi:hypothetical protein
MCDVICYVYGVKNGAKSEESIMSKDTTSPFGLRMPSELRELLDAAAEGNRRSLNLEIVKRLQKSFENDPVLRPEEFFDLLSIDGVFRLRSTSTFRDMQRLCFMIERAAPKTIVLGARREPVNRYALVAVMDTGPLKVVADKTLLNIARSAREVEVQHLFHVLVEKRQWRGVSYIPSHVPDTAHLPADHALTVLQTLPAEPLTAENLADYLRLLTDHPQLLVLADYLADREFGETGDW